MDPSLVLASVLTDVQAGLEGNVPEAIGISLGVFILGYVVRKVVGAFR